MASLKRSINFILGKEEHLQESATCPNCRTKMERTTFTAKRMLNDVSVPIWYCSKCQYSEEAY